MFHDVKRRRMDFSRLHSGSPTLFKLAHLCLVSDPVYKSSDSTCTPTPFECYAPISRKEVAFRDNIHTDPHAAISPAKAEICAMLARLFTEQL